MPARSTTNGLTALGALSSWKKELARAAPFHPSLHPSSWHASSNHSTSIPPAYSPIHRSIIGSYAGVDDYLDKFVPSSFTNPLTAAAARVYAPLRSDYADNPWIQILGHGLYNPHVSLSSCLAHSGL
jgi:hypothetical protein